MALRRSKKATKNQRTRPDSGQIAAKIQERAYNLYEKKGCSQGNDWSDWFEAERQVKREFGIR